MRLPQLAVQRPVTITMCIFAILLFGAISLDRLGLELLPELNLPMVAVATVYPGADPLTVEEQVTRPIEGAVSTVNRLKRIDSYSVENVSVVVAQFDWGTDIADASDEIRANLELATYALPNEAEDPIIMKLDPAQMALMTISVSSDMNVTELTNTVDRVILPALEQVPGVAQVSTVGGSRKRIEVRYDLQKLKENHITPTTLQQVLTYQNAYVPSGVLQDNGTRYNVKVGYKLTSIEDIENLVVGTKKPEQTSQFFGITSLMTQPLLIGDVATVQEGYQEFEGYSRVNGKSSILLNIYKLADQNSVEVSDRVREALRSLDDQLGDHLEITVVTDQADFIRSSINSLARNGLLGAILAILILFLFLRSSRSILVVAVAMPISIVATFVLMYFGHLTINVMTLGGLALGVGMLIDSSIVVLENIHRHRKSGKSRVEAAEDGASQVSSAITASTLTTLAVFLPVVFVGGLAGELFRELGLTVSFSLVASLFVALSVVPMLSSRFLKLDASEGTIAAMASDQDENAYGPVFTRFQNAFARSLSWVLAHKLLVGAVILAAIAATAAVFPLLGTEFLPAMDEGVIDVQVKLPPGTPVDKTNEVVLQVEDIVREIPDVETISTQIGTSSGIDILSLLGESGVNIGRITVKLKDRGERSLSAGEVASLIKQRTSDIEGVTVLVNDEISTGALAGLFGPGLTVEFRGEDTEVLRGITQEFMARLRAEGGFTDIRSSLDQQQPEIVLNVEPTRALLGGLTSAQLGLSVRGALTGIDAGELQRGGESIPIVLIPEGREEADLAGLLTYEIPSAFNLNGDTPTYARLNRIAKPVKTEGPVSIQRAHRLRSVTVTSTLDGIGQKEGRNRIYGILEEMELPDGYLARLAGLDEFLEESYSDLTLALILAIVLIYMVMAAQFESFLSPFIIMFTVPLAGIGGIWGLYLTGQKIGISSLIGLIMLTGIAVNNGIVLVDYINRIRSSGCSAAEAAVQAARIRLRPIMMTALTTILGLIPLALGIGEGSEIQVPLAVSVIGGLTTATVLTLYVIPAVYVALDGLLRSRKAAGSSSVTETQEL